MSEHAFQKTVDTAEVEKFSAMAEEWWDPQGKFKPLHLLNPTRIAYVRDQAIAHFDIAEGAKTLSSLSVLDIGCGGGLLSEPMARLGASVTAIDASEKNIAVASLHAEKVGLDIDYQATTVEALAEDGKQFDIVLNMEVVEHVADVDIFISASCQLVKPGGLLFFATLNRTAKSYLYAIIGAEYIMRWLPRGTHDWHKFLKPSEIKRHVDQSGLSLSDMKGMEFNVLTNKWKLGSNLDVNYLMTFSR